MNNTEYQSIEEYLSLPYTIEIVRDETGSYSGWYARVIELPGCMTQANTFEELGTMIEEAMRGWLEVAIEDGYPIPIPRPEEDYSGKFVVRVPKSLHRELVDNAERDGVSLNAYINMALSKSVGSESHSIVEIDTQSQTPRPIWPHLSNTAWRAMIAAGIDIEAEALTEQLFANWLENLCQQIQAALDIDLIHDAQSHLADLKQALRICGQTNPIMNVFHSSVEILESQVEQAAQLRAGNIQRQTIDKRILSHSRTLIVSDLPYPYQINPSDNIEEDDINIDQKQDLFRYGTNVESTEENE